jgi:hypothetical protein
MRGEFNPSFFMWWLPSFRAWVSALLLLMLLTPFALLLHTVGLLGLLTLGLLQPQANWPILAFLLAIGLIVPVFIWSHVHQFFWGEPAANFPKWIPSPSSWGEGLFTWMVTLIALFTVGLLFVAYVETNCLSAYSCLYRDHEEVAGGLCGFFVVYSAYLYHWRLMFGRWWDSPARLKWFKSGKAPDKRNPKN